MGTPAFAVPSLEALAAATSLVGVVSQPERPQGRGLVSLRSPVAERAVALGVPLICPARIREPEVLATLGNWRPDVIVVAAYGKILPPSILELPPLGAINVHASLLPRHRGAAPIAAAILAGDTESGVTIMAMNEQMDAGDILLQRALPIAADDTTGTLSERLAPLGALALRETLELIRSEGVGRVPQDAALVSYAPRLERDDGRIRWREAATLIERKVRAFTPWPSAFTSLRGRRVKVLKARPLPAFGSHAPASGAPDAPAPPTPGTVIALDEAVRVAAGAGAVDLLVLQMEGKRALPAAAFVAGTRLLIGDRFGD